MIAALSITTPEAQSGAADGQRLAFDRGKGNCLSCHEIKGGDLAGTIGPALKDIKSKYPEDAFQQKDEGEAIKLLYGRTAEPSDKVKLDAPEIAENGAVVPIAVTTTLTEVTSVSFLVSENPNVLASYYKIPPGTMPNVANRLKMAKTTNVTAIVEAGGKLFSATKEVKVTVGGCGG